MNFKRRLPVVYGFKRRYSRAFDTHKKMNFSILFNKYFISFLKKNEINI